MEAPEPDAHPVKPREQCALGHTSKKGGAKCKSGGKSKARRQAKARARQLAKGTKHHPDPAFERDLLAARELACAKVCGSNDSGCCLGGVSARLVCLSACVSLVGLSRW